MLRGLRTIGRLSILLFACGVIGLGGCSSDESEASGSGAKRSANKTSRKRAAQKGATGADQAQKQLWTMVAAKPSTCDGGTNKRSVKKVLVTKQEPTADGKYLKVHGAATINETGPCEGTGTHTWKVSMTLTQEGDKWRPASFGYDQKIK